MRRRNKKKIDAKYAEKKALIAEFHAKEHEHYLAAGMARRQRAAAFALQRREEEIQEAEEAKKEAEEALAQNREKFKAWAVQEGGSDLQFMNINSTAQVQQLLFAPSGCVCGG